YLTHHRRQQLVITDYRTKAIRELCARYLRPLSWHGLSTILLQASPQSVEVDARFAQHLSNAFLLKQALNEPADTIVSRVGVILPVRRRRVAPLPHRGCERLFPCERTTPQSAPLGEDAEAIDPGK